MRFRIRLETPPSRQARHTFERQLSQRLRLDLEGVRVITSQLPTVLPISQSQEEAETLVHQFVKMGAQAVVLETPEGRGMNCPRHERFLQSAHCRTCGAGLCVVCERRSRGLCEECRAKQQKKNRNQRIRIGILLALLFAVGLLAIKEWRRRTLTWDPSQRLAIVLVEPPGTRLTPELVSAFSARAPDVEDRLRQQRSRYLPGAPPPVKISVLGPVPEQGAPPVLASTGILDLLRFNLRLGSYAQEQDALCGLREELFDVRIYMRILESGGDIQTVEGIGQKGGRIGIASTHISEEGVDFAWFVAIHEYMHTRGANDKYDAEGRAVHPEGFAEPDRVPLFPQLGTEIMTRGQPFSPGNELMPGPPETWVIGGFTAREIAWTSDESGSWPLPGAPSDQGAQGLDEAP